MQLFFHSLLCQYIPLCDKLISVPESLLCILPKIIQFVQMLHSVLDDGNFVVIPESVVDVWAGERYSETHTKQTLREINGFDEDDLIIVVLGSSLFYDDFSWDNAVAMHMLGPLLTQYGRRKETGGPFKFIFLFGNSTNAVQVRILHPCEYYMISVGCDCIL